MKVLVTGGLGFIGSHVVVELINENHEVVIVDNLYNTNIEVLDSIYDITGVKPRMYVMDVCDKENFEKVFQENDIDAVIHFAGYKAVGESVAKPIKYYRNNLVSTIVLAELCMQYGVKNIVFSSSATVYGEQESPLREDMQLFDTVNPYGETKAMNERILMDLVKADDSFSVVILRYFNPVGAHKSGLLGENTDDIPNNLMPYILKVAGKEFDKLNIFGKDYDTIDGTGVRDYIHVVDLARGHVLAMKQFGCDVKVYNLGTGKGTSVLEIVEAFKKVNGVDVPYEFTERRAGDLATCYADCEKAKIEIDFNAQYTVDDMVRDAWNFYKKDKNIN